MSIKDYIQKRKKQGKSEIKEIVVEINKVDNSELAKTLADDSSKDINGPINLNEKVDEFINWYNQVMVKEYDNVSKTANMRNFIEKMAVWYELRYPDYEINRIFNCAGQEPTSINDVMFKDNKYISILFGDKSDIKDLDWYEFYNTHAFIRSLPSKEKCYFSRPKYRNFNSGDIRLELTPTGIIKELTLLSPLKALLSPDERETIGDYFKGKNIELLLKFLKRRISGSFVCSDLEQVVSEYNNRIYQKEEMLNSVMYRIIERGGNRFGPRRAYLFAKEFGRNKDIPIQYAIDRSDPGLRELINDYLKGGGKTDLVCYENYFSGRVRKTSICEILQTKGYDAVRLYTPEETELHKKIAVILDSQIDKEKLKNEQVKELRLSRKLEKAKSSNKRTFYNEWYKR